METDKITNKFLRVAMDTTDTDTDNSALYCSALEEISLSTSEVFNDDSTLEAGHELSLEKTMEKTVKHKNSPAVKRFANSPLLFSGRKHFLKQNVSSTPCHTIAPDENDINIVNKGNVSKLTLNFPVSDKSDMEIVNQKLEQVKLELPQKANWRFTSPSNPAYINPDDEPTKEVSPGEIQFQKTALRLSMEYEEDLFSVAPPLTGRPSMVIDDFEPMKQMFKVKTPAKQLLISETDTESDASPAVPAEIVPPKTLEQVFEKMAAGMANSSIDEIYSAEKPAIKESLLPKRTSISTAYRKNVISKASSVPVGMTEGAARKRATWASRQVTVTLPEIAEKKGPSRKSFLPTAATGATKKRQSLHPAALKPTTSVPKKPVEEKPKQTTLKIATVSVGNRRSSFGKPVGKLNIRKSMLPSRPSPKPARRSVMPLVARRSVMPPPSTSSILTRAFPHPTGAIPKQKNDLMCKYCDKKFAIVKALDDHLLVKCTKIPAKDKKQLLSHNYAARELEYSRRGSRTLNDPMESSSSSSTNGSAMKSLPRTNRAHSGVVHTPNKQITCMACGAKFASVVKFTIHMTSEHAAVAKKDDETPTKGN